MAIKNIIRGPRSVSASFTMTLTEEGQEFYRRMFMKEMTEEDFKNHLRDAGWSEEEIEAEWNSIQEDDESGYDGP